MRLTKGDIAFAVAMAVIGVVAVAGAGYLTLHPPRPAQPPAVVGSGR